jgi:hypothetical protein
MAYVRRNTEKNYKLPGVIALALFLPIIFVYYLFQTGLFDVQHGITIFIEPKNCEGELLCFKFDASGRKYAEFKITGDKEADEKKIVLARKEIRKLIDSKDTLRGVHFYFTKKSTYNEFVEVINICEEEHSDLYIPRGYDFWVINTGPPKYSDRYIQPM